MEVSVRSGPIVDNIEKIKCRPRNSKSQDVLSWHIVIILLILFS